MTPGTLLAVPNFSEGRDLAALDAIASALRAATLLDLHTDPDHNRSVFTVAARPGALANAVAAAAATAVDRIDITNHQGVHPFVGALDVAPIVHLSDADRGAACAEALVLGDLLGHELQLPVFLYGELARGRSRAELRRGGPAELARRIATRELRPDFGPRTGLHPTAGAVLVGARPPLVAFNIELERPATVDDAQRIAAAIRESGTHGLAGVRAIGLWLEHQGVAQVSTNVEDYLATPLRVVVGAVAKHARVRRAELVGLAPRAAFEAFPPDVPLIEPPRLIEDALNL